MLQGVSDNLVWNISPTSGALATNNQLTERLLNPCVGDDCTLNSNPTGWVFNSTGIQSVSVSGTIVNADGTYHTNK